MQYQYIWHFSKNNFITCKLIFYHTIMTFDAVEKNAFWKHKKKILLSHNNPCFKCNIAITNFLVSHLLKAGFTCSHTMTPFETSKEWSLLKTLWEKEKLPVQAISPFPTMFFTLPKTEIIIFVTSNLSSANAFNLVWSKILLCGNGLITFSKTRFTKFYLNS